MGHARHDQGTSASPQHVSNWIWSVGDTLQNDGPANCVLRVGPDSDRPDADFELKYADLTDGPEGAMFTYLGEQKALFSAFYDDQAEYDETTEVYEVAGQPHWHVWTVDLETRKAAPLSGINPTQARSRPCESTAGPT